MTLLLSLDKVSFAYDGAPVVVDVDLEIETGDFLGLVGPSGSGKTTLLRLMAGNLSPTRGGIRQTRTRVGYVPQVETVNWFFPVTVAEILFMAMPRSRPRPVPQEIETATRLLARLGLGGLASRHIRELSGGQQQRVFIARALIGNPDLLLLDEPTGSIDVATRHEIMHLLHDLHHAGIAVVLTTHDLNGVAAHLPRIACLNRRLVAAGPPAEVLTPEVLERTYGAPLDVLKHAGLPVVVDRGGEEGHHEHHL